MAIVQNKGMRILAIIVAVILGVVGTNYTRFAGLQKIENDEDMYSMYVPKNWIVEYADPSPTIDISGAFAYDDTKENFIFIIVSPTTEEDFENDLAEWQKQFEAVNFTYLSSEIQEVKGMKKAVYEATIMNGETPYYQTGFITYANGNKYMVLAQCKEENKTDMLPIFNKSFSTFKLK